jgi:hypothetical protein
MTEKSQCKVRTKSGTRCKNAAKHSGHCYVHRSPEESPERTPIDRTQRTAALLGTGVSLIALVEKAIEYLPGLFEPIASITPEYVHDPWEISKMRCQLKNGETEKVVWMAHHLSTGLHRHRNYGRQHAQYKGLLDRLPVDLQIALLDECARVKYFVSLLQNLNDPA